MKELILMSAQQIQSHRSKSAIYNLFTGNRSIQTVQDAHLFGIYRFYGVLPTLSRQTFDQHILQCIEKGLLEEYQKDDSSYVVLSRKGEQFLKQATEPIN